MNDATCDRMDIMDVLNRYAITMDRREWDRMEACFMPDVVATLPFVGEIHGSAKLAEVIKGAIERLGQTHTIMGSHLADINGDEAEVVCYCRAYHPGAGRHEGKFQESLVVFSGTMVRTGDGWRIAQWLEDMPNSLGTTDVFQP